MRDLSRRVIGIGTLAACIAFGGGLARADLTVKFLNSVAVTGGSDWTYQVALDQIQNVNNTDFANFITIYDFGTNTYMSALTTGSLIGWLGSSNLTDTKAFNTTPLDDPTILNFRLTAPPSTFINGPATLGTFTLFSPAGPDSAGFRVVSTDGQAFQTSAPVGQHGNVGSTIAPVPAPAMGAGLPGLIAACGGLLGLARRRRRRQIA